MRYAVISQGLSLSEVEAKVQQYGGKDIRLAPLSGQVFCELDPEKAQLLAREPGLAVRPVERIQLQEARGQKPELSRARDRSCLLPLESGLLTVYGPVYAAAQTAISSLFFDFRTMFDPAVTGVGFTIAVLDSGIRKTHLGLKDKVIYEANFGAART